MSEQWARVWEEQVTIPTYGTGEPDKNPMFFEKRVYQGSSGVVYPNPVIESICDEKTDKTYTGLFLENRYLRIMILPELGGRIQMAYDKIKQRHFIYYNQVIKPALVGLTGPWISGGIEFNWPQHHRPSTFEPVDYAISENPDGSRTVWVSEVEKMFRTKGMAGFTIYPDKAYLEISVKLYNRTNLPQTFLWWANPAVKVNDDYQSVFPPDVNAVFDHGKRDVSSFPIATGTYYKVDYSPGTDISRYKNIPVPTSYMAINSSYDFVGGYEHDTRAGLLHVANHHVSPGKKQWTWGHSDFGRAWDRNLTDEDGPYIELMTGVFTDNQPDFSWLMPYEEKAFTQYFLPYRELGVVKNATKDVLVSIQEEEDKATVRAFATSAKPRCCIRFYVKAALLIDEQSDLSPESVFVKQILLPEAASERDYLLTVNDEYGNELIRYEPASNQEHPFPSPAKPAPEPADVENNEQLFLTGQHLEQYRHATRSPVPYYEEAIRRDPGDIRNNTALGAWYIRRGMFAEGEPYLRKAIETQLLRNPNPYDGEALHLLGLSLTYQGRPAEAYGCFYKSAWNAAWQGAAFFSLAQLDLSKGDFPAALEHIQSSLDRNARNMKARVLKAVALRKLNRREEALQVCEDAISQDRFNLGALFEEMLIRQLTDRRKAEETLQLLKIRSREFDHSLIEYALDYAAAGLYSEASDMLNILPEEKRTPMVYYHLAYFAAKQGAPAQKLLLKAQHCPSYLCFPNRLEDIAALRYAISANPGDAMAPYYLGNLFYDKRQYAEAIRCWIQSLQKDESFPTVHRNLGIAYFNKRKEPARALAAFTTAFNLDTTDARILMEFDQLQKRLNHPPSSRLKFLEAHRETVLKRDDLYLEMAALHNFLGNYSQALNLIMSRKFHPWEGGEGKVSGQYVYSLTERAKSSIRTGDFTNALELLSRAQHYPHNLGEGKLYGAQENDIFYWLGCAHEGAGDEAKARQYLKMATNGLSEPSAAVFYNDQQPDKIFYQALAWQKLGEHHRAGHILHKLVEYGEAHLNDEVKLDYFAVSLPDLLVFEDDLSLRNSVHCRYMTALGWLGLGEKSKAKSVFARILKDDAMHFGAKTHARLL
jgi:tetratricopeptide (TPR) repeat protein